METVRGSMYDFPAYYDLVYGSDWQAEYHFLCGSFQRYADGPVRRVFEPACGTGRLLFRLGRAGYDVSGLDLNPRAVEYCRRRFVRHGVRGRVWTGDMADFELPRPVDAAFNMINSFRHLQDAAGARRHLERMARAVRRGGVYVLGLHLTPTQGVPTSEESWEARRGHLVVRTRLWVKRRDLRRRLETCGVTYDVVTPSRHLRLTDEVSFRTYTWAQLRRLLREVSAWELAATHDFSYDLSVAVPVTSTSEDLILVLRKK
ncbi:MAG: class I SAM-dependent methyltransferase [Pirellulaceae bacterium]|nr:class I SAM-dependent methyltransferase [Pirellulaceae bacterium]